MTSHPDAFIGSESAAEQPFEEFMEDQFEGVALTWDMGDTLTDILWFVADIPGVAPALAIYLRAKGHLDPHASVMHLARAVVEDDHPLLHGG